MQERVVERSTPLLGSELWLGARGHAVEQGIAAALGRSVVVGSADRLWLNRLFKQPELLANLTDHQGEVIPTGHTGIALVQDAVSTALDQGLPVAG